MALPDPRLLLPRAADRYVGPAIALWFLAAYNVVGTARSLIHVLAPDSGAQSIATMDTSVAGGPNMIALLAQWGGAQLLMAIAIWIVIWRYRGLVPLALLFCAVDNVHRVVIGLAKPLTTVGTPPGSLSWVVAPLCVVVLLLSLLPARDGATGG